MIIQGPENDRVKGRSELVMPFLNIIQFADKNGQIKAEVPRLSMVSLTPRMPPKVLVLEIGNIRLVGRMS